MIKTYITSKNAVIEKAIDFFRQAWYNYIVENTAHKSVTTRLIERISYEKNIGVGCHIDSDVIAYRLRQYILDFRQLNGR